MNIKKTVILPLILGASMIVTGCNKDTISNNNGTNTVQVENKDPMVIKAIENKVNQLRDMLVPSDDKVYDPVSSKRYNIEVNQLIDEVQSLKTVKEVNDYDIEVSAKLTKRIVFTNIGDIKDAVSEKINVKGVIVGKQGTRKLMIDDGTGRIDIICNKVENQRTIDFDLGTSIIVTGKVSKQKTNKLLKFDVEDGAIVSRRIIPVESNKDVKEFNGEDFTNLYNKFCNVEEALPTTYEYHPQIKFTGVLSKQEAPNKLFFHYNLAVEGTSDKYTISLNPTSELESYLVDGNKYTFTGIVDELVKEKFVNVYVTEIN